MNVKITRITPTNVRHPRCGALALLRTRHCSQPRLPKRHIGHTPIQGPSTDSCPVLVKTTRSAGGALRGCGRGGPGLLNAVCGSRSRERTRGGELVGFEHSLKPHGWEHSDAHCLVLISVSGSGRCSHSGKLRQEPVGALYYCGTFL